MDRSLGTVRTGRGELVVEPDALHLRKSPREFLTGQGARFREGTMRQRLRAVRAIGALLLFLALLGYHLLDAAGTTAGLALLMTALYVGGTVHQFREQYVTDTHIPRSEIEDVTLDPDDRELTVEHTHDPGRLPSLTPGSRETTLELPGYDEFREAKTLLRLVRPDDEFEADTHRDRDREYVEYDYRVETRDGVVFCEACDARVSPSDDRCPSCNVRLRVERVVETA